MQAGKTSAEGTGGTLNDRIFEVMEHVEYRRIVTPEDFESIGKLRSQAFDARVVYARKFNGTAVDDSDYAPNVRVYGMYYLNSLVATVRINLISKLYPESFSTRMWPQVLMPLIEQGMTFIDPTRFAVDEEVSHSVPGLPLLTLRVPLMATTYFNASTCLAPVKSDHSGFYRRVFRSTVLGGPDQFKDFAAPLVLMSSPRENTPDICRRYPVFYSTASERKLMFEKPAEQLPALTVLPTAKYAMARAA